MKEDYMRSGFLY